MLMAKTPKLSKSALKYWEKRRELEDKARLKLENETLKMITDIFPTALKRIQEKLLSQSDLHKINQQKLLEDAKKRDQQKYRKYIEDNYKSLMNSDEKYQAFIDEFFPAYDYAKVNRLLQIRSDIFSILAEEMINKGADTKFNDRLDDFINRIYNSNSNALGHILGTGDFSPLPKKEIERMLNYPWSGKTFSSRLWGNVSKLEQSLSQAIVNAVASGGGVVDALKTMRQDPSISDMFKLEKDKFNRAIENLVRTEYAHFAVDGINASFEEAGVRRSISWSAEDERVCSICGGYHGKEIKKGGIDPPYHTRCRCTKIPDIPDLGEDIDTLYESMFGDLLDEFAKKDWGIALNHPTEDKKRYNKNKGFFNFDPKDHQLTRNDAIRKLVDEFGMDIVETSRTKLSEVALNQTYGVLDGFRDLYNVLPEKIPQVRALTKTQAGQAIAWYSRNGYSSSPVEFGINTAYFKSDDILKSMTKNNVENGWFSKNTAPNHVMVHEFAHHLDYQLTKLLNDSFSETVFKNMVESSDKYDISTIAKEIGGYAGSYYSSKRKQTESFAEIFAEAYGATPREVAEDFRKEFEKLAEEVIKNAGLA